MNRAWFWDPMEHPRGRGGRFIPAPLTALGKAARGPGAARAPKRKAKRRKRKR